VLELIAAIKYLSWDAIESRLESHPEEAGEIDKFGVTAIHHAVRKAAPIHIIRMLLEAFPEGLDLSDDMTGFNALHLVCERMYKSNSKSKEKKKIKESKSDIGIDNENENENDTKMEVHILNMGIASRGNSNEITKKQSQSQSQAVLVHGCQSTCIIQTMLAINPGSARHACLEGRVPLHRAKTYEIARMLIGIHPDGLSVRSKNHYLPLHDACSNNSVPADVVQFLMEEGRKRQVGIEYCQNKFCGGVLVKDLHGDIPLKILFRRIMFGNGKSLTTDQTQVGGEDDDDDDDDPQWTKLCIVVKGTYLAFQSFPESCKTDSKSVSQSETTVPLVHAIIACGGHPQIVKHALKLKPEEALLRDDRGRTALAVAASKVDTPRETIQILVDHNQCAAKMSDEGGRLPLHLAIESGRALNNGVDLIAHAAPLALQTRDMETRFYPFQIAAVPNYRWDNTSIDGIFQLLRSSPNVMRTYSGDGER